MIVAEEHCSFSKNVGFLSQVCEGRSSIGLFIWVNFRQGPVILLNSFPEIFK